MPINVGPSNLDLNKILVIRLAQLIKTYHFHENIASDVEKWFDALTYDKRTRRSLPV